MLELILPAGVESEERFGEPPGGTLFPEEEKLIAHAVPTRQREYAVVRSCARACLERLGYPQSPILPGVGGAPTWPAGVLGSMTHCAGYAAAAVGPLPQISAIGIDAEPDAPLPDGVLDVVATAAERDRLAVMRPESFDKLRTAPVEGRASTGSARMVTQPVFGGPNWDRLLFSAKEALYKAWFPLVGEWLDHQEAEIRFHPQDATFTAQLFRDGLIIDGRPVDRLHGRWIRKRRILVTAVFVAST
jgi:4'-phosphopantetheinyl transferase EntD